MLTAVLPPAATLTAVLRASAMLLPAGALTVGALTVGALPAEALPADSSSATTLTAVLLIAAPPPAVVLRAQPALRGRPLRRPWSART
jgi:hypothetical protein